MDAKLASFWQVRDLMDSSGTLWRKLLISRSIIKIRNIITHVFRIGEAGGDEFKAVNYLNEKECWHVVIRYPGGRPQCQSEWLIYGPSIWYMRYSDGVDFSRAGLLSQRTNGLGRRRGGPIR
ncbi:hypothetical protein TNCV_1859411 [Trichonephila clavipes]|nr:hypothetical protein TNCV_1859411 [Trichonephila clavipes]